MKVTAGRSGVDWVIVFKDSDGRKVGVMRSFLLYNPDVLRRLSRDVAACRGHGLRMDPRAAEILGVPAG